MGCDFSLDSNKGLVILLVKGKVLLARQRDEVGDDSADFFVLRVQRIVL